MPRKRAGDSAEAPKQPTEKVTLTPYEGKEVLATTVSVTGAGDGLSKAMEVEPIELHHGERVFLAMELDVAKIRYDPIPDTKGLMRVHILKADTATIVDEKLIRDALDEQRRKIEAAAGVHHLPFAAVTDPDEDGGDGSGDDGEPPLERPEGMSDEEWEASVAAFNRNAGQPADDGGDPLS